MAVSARRIALKIKNAIDSKSGYSNLELRSQLAKTDLSSRDKALVTELVSGTLRRQGTIDWIITVFSNTPFDKLDLIIKNILRLAIYQIWFIDNIPDYAAINEAVEMVKTFSPNRAPFINGLLRAALRNKSSLPWPDRDEKPAEYISIKYSHPLWLVKRMLLDMGIEETEKVCRADNLRPQLTLRTNLLRIDRVSLIKKLKIKNIDARPGPYTQESIVIVGGSIADYGFDSGDFYLQNEASILAGTSLNAKAGEAIIELCAGPGGKTTHIGQLMRNQGEIFAVEINEKRLRLVMDNCERLGVKIVKPVLGDATRILDLPQADRILIDAPCSGLGVLSRRPDLRWQRREQDIGTLALIQDKLLNQAVSYIKNNGLIIYSVCTNTREETSDVIDKFIKSHRNFKIEKLSEISKKLGLSEKNQFIQTQTYIQGLDGMFVAALRKLS
ncbi:MAG TPA: 16S rRNA (cytosine(967)-C(5))-methyltransferase RsmB, partial [Actinobacteria bacterium]|nr:16S rRNA (cytosine(967)-C(5))-methyltransferase RsmB [Actinomycetes bacterium]HEX21392.1 16S rRNA (cytosine(967)-C(5))-methyltransferase RsmB [Actinomycetota bacterium]